MPVVWEYSGMENVDIGPPKVYVNRRQVGWLNGDCSLNIETSVLPLKYGVPLSNMGQVITERTATLSFEMLELTPDNYLMGFGDASLSDGGGQTWITVGNENGTFALQEGDTQQSITLAHHPVRDVIVRSSDEQTTYEPDTDFVFDPNLGKVFRVAAGSIAESASVKISYEYAEEQQGGGSIKLQFGAASALQTLENVVIHKYNPRRSGKQHQIVKIWKMQSNGNVNLNYSTDTGSFMSLPAEFNIIADTENHPQSPFCEIEWADSFDPQNP